MKRCPQCTTAEGQGPHFPICKMRQLLPAEIVVQIPLTNYGYTLPTVQDFTLECTAGGVCYVSS